MTDKTVPVRVNPVILDDEDISLNHELDLNTGKWFLDYTHTQLGWKVTLFFTGVPGKEKIQIEFRGHLPLSSQRFGSLNTFDLHVMVGSSTDVVLRLNHFHTPLEAVVPLLQLSPLFLRLRDQELPDPEDEEVMEDEDEEKMQNAGSQIADDWFPQRDNERH
ncbi:MAG TPA: hypothetical protein VEC17_01365 [Candidatus Binatia bacterium]|nr:hypothetical protein [Candidatus Binatia bacterium]